MMPQPNHILPLLRKWIETNSDISPKTLQDMEWTVRQYLHWMETQGITCVSESPSHCFAGFMASVSGKYHDGSLYDLQLYLRKFHAFLTAQLRFI